MPVAGKLQTKKSMKRLLTIVAALALLVTGCKKDETTSSNNNNNNNNTDNNYYFKAKIDGTDWSADMASTNTYAQVPHAGLLTISASLTTVTDGFFLGNIKYNGPGTYKVGVGGEDNYIRYTTGTVANNTYSAWKAEVPGSTTSGTIIVTKDDAGVIEGTVEFDGYSEEKKTTKKITEGKFRMKKS